MWQMIQLYRGLDQKGERRSDTVKKKYKIIIIILATRFDQTILGLVSL